MDDSSKVDDDTQLKTFTFRPNNIGIKFSPVPLPLSLHTNRPLVRALACTCVHKQENLVAAVANDLAFEGPKHGIKAGWVLRAVPIPLWHLPMPILALL